LSAATASTASPGPLPPAPAWLPGGQLQTIWPALFSRRHAPGRPPVWARERWTTPDGDFIDVDRLQPRQNPVPGPQAPLLVIFHGLEGSSSSHYAQAFAERAEQLGWACALPHFRGCSGELNRAPRAYHSGDFEEIGWMLARLTQGREGPVHAVGVSLGGNALLRWAQESGEQAARQLRSIAAICAPLDLAAAGDAIGRGLNRRIYTPMFLRTMKPKALAKLAQHPGLFDAARLRAARDLREFDDVFTGPLHGFAGVDDYWRRASSRHRLAEIRVPALVINPLNDPFVPAGSLPAPHEAGRAVELWQPAHGGHVGFASGAWPGEVRTLPQRVCDWLQGRDMGLRADLRQDPRHG
jgi:predicted alpha/beta-fold hydrolase